MADLIARIPEFTSAEAELSSVQTRLQTLEAKAKENARLSETVQSLEPISEDSIPVNLKSVQSTFAQVEAESQLAILKQKLDVKQVKETAGKISQVRSEYLSLLKEIQMRTGNETRSMTEHIEEMSAKSQRDRDVLTTAIDDMQVLDRGKTGGKNWLQEELCATVDTALSELQGALDFRLKQLELTFKQECLGLRNQFESLKSRAMQLNPNADVDGAELNRLHDEAKAAIAKVENYSNANTANLKEVVESITENLLLTSSSLQGYLQGYRKARPAEQPSFASSKKTEFEEQLSSIKFQIDMLRKNVEAIETSTNSELFKIEECSKLVAAGGEEYADLLPRFAKLKAKLPENTRGLKGDVETLSQRLLGLWTQANQEGGLKIPLPSNVSDMQKDGMDALISLLDTPESSKPFKQSNLS